MNITEGEFETEFETKFENKMAVGASPTPSSAGAKKPTLSSSDYTC